MFEWDGPPSTWQSLLTRFATFFDQGEQDRIAVSNPTAAASGDIEGKDAIVRERVVGFNVPKTKSLRAKRKPKALSLDPDEIMQLGDCEESESETDGSEEGDISRGSVSDEEDQDDGLQVAKVSPFSHLPLLLPFFFFLKEKKQVITETPPLFSQDGM